MNIKKMAQWAVIMSALIGGKTIAQNNREADNNCAVAVSEESDPYIQAVIQAQQKPSVVIPSAENDQENDPYIRAMNGEHSILENDPYKKPSVLIREHSIVEGPRSILVQGPEQPKRSRPAPLEAYREPIVPETTFEKAPTPAGMISVLEGGPIKPGEKKGYHGEYRTIYIAPERGLTPDAPAPIYVMPASRCQGR